MYNIINLPNLLSLSRIALTPIFIWFFFGNFKSQVFAIIIFSAAAITDAYDGYFARKNKNATKLGAFIDPLADKILILSAFSIFAYIQIISWYVVLILALRDLIVTQLRIKLLNEGSSLTTSKIAKLKTVFLFVGIYLLFLSSLLHNFFSATQLQCIDLIVRLFTLWLVFFSVYTCIDYIVQFLKLKMNKSIHSFKYIVCHLISTFFYTGLFPVAPGTAGSLASVIVIYFLPTHLIFFNIAMTLGLLVIGVITSAHIERTLQIKDPSWIVIDETLGMFLTVFWIPKDWKLYALAFILFRFFDITKFFPIKHIENIESPGWGIMLDDVFAAIYACIALFVILKINGMF